MIAKFLILIGIDKKEIDWLSIYFVGFFLIVFLIDALLVFFTRIYKPSLKNSYYDFHRRHGLFKVSLLKTIISYILIYVVVTFRGSVINAGWLVFIPGLSLIFTWKLLKDLLKKDKVVKER